MGFPLPPSSCVPWPQWMDRWPPMRGPLFSLPLVGSRLRVWAHSSIHLSRVYIHTIEAEHVSAIRPLKIGGPGICFWVIPTLEVPRGWRIGPKVMERENKLQALLSWVAKTHVHNVKPSLIFATGSTLFYVRHYVWWICLTLFTFILIHLSKTLKINYNNKNIVLVPVKGKL